MARPAGTYRAARRNAKHGRKAVGKTKPGEGPPRLPWRTWAEINPASIRARRKG